MQSISRSLSIIFISLLLSACSFNDMYVRMSMIVMESKIAALQHESDYLRVRDRLPDNIAALENLLLRDVHNPQLHVYAANAYYLYGFGFVEDENRQRASSLYYQGFMHASQALQHYGISTDLWQGPTNQLEAALAKLNRDAIDALFFAALCWSKVVEMNSDQMVVILQLHKAVLLMQRVYALDEKHRMGGAHLFFAAYYGGRPPLLGGNYSLSRAYFEKARQQNHNRLLLVDYLQARYLWQQMGDRQAFHDTLTALLQDRADLLPEQALLNSIARHKAAHLLRQEPRLFGQAD